MGQKMQGIRYPSQFKSFAFKLHYIGVPTYVIARALGCSTKTVWKWVVTLRDGHKVTRRGWRRKYPNRFGVPIEPHLKGKIKAHGLPRDGTVQRVREAFQRLLRWIHFMEAGGYLDLEACLRGEEPP